jgi:hypothetical protein
MAVNLTDVSRLKARFPNLRLRPALPADFPRMARLANAVFQHERDINYFDEHHDIKIESDSEAEADDELLAADNDWRLAQLRRNHKLPGRLFLVATYAKLPPDFLQTRKRRTNEEILGWAEWQDPQVPPVPASRRSNRLPSDTQEARNTLLGPLWPTVKSLSFKHDDVRMLGLPNGLPVRARDAATTFGSPRTTNQQNGDAGAGRPSQPASAKREIPEESI